MMALRRRLLGTETPTALAALLCISTIGCGDVGRSAEAGADPVERWPERPITLVTHVTPGSPTDVLARTIARIGPRYFGQEFQVLNRPGGSGAVAMSYLLSRPADGYTLAIATSSSVITMAAGQIPFEADQFTYIQRMQLDPLLIAVRADSPFEDLPSLYRYARANPGRVSIGGFGATSIHFLTSSKLWEEAGDPDIRWIAYDGSSDAAVAVLGGHVDATDNNYSVVREHLRAGTLRVLGVSQALDALPGTPTYRDQGFDVDAVHWRGVMAPAGLPEPLAAKIHDLLTQTARDPDFRRFMEESGNAYGLMESPTGFHQWVLDEVASSREALRGLGLLRGAESQ